MSKESVCDKTENTWNMREKSIVKEESYSLQKPINRHVESFHKGKEPYKCNVCDAVFSEKQPMNRHIASVHKRKKNI